MEMRQQTILVVDDEVGVLDVAVNILAELGYDVIGARSGKEALAILDERPSIALLLTDIVMPGGIGGWDLARHAKHMRPGLKVVYTTAYRGHLQLEAAEPSFGPLLSKPWRADQLVGLVRWALAQ